MMAGAYGVLKDAMQSDGQGAALEAEIVKFPNFEHLEAMGRLEKEGQ